MRFKLWKIKLWIRLPTETLKFSGGRRAGDLIIKRTIQPPVVERMKRRERKKAIEMAKSRGIWAGEFLGRKEETGTRFDTQHRRSIGSLGTHHLDWGPLELNYSTTKEYAYGIGQVARQPTREQQLQNRDLRIQASTRTAKLQLPNGWISKEISSICELDKDDLARWIRCNKYNRTPGGQGITC